MKKILICFFFLFVLFRIESANAQTDEHVSSSQEPEGQAARTESVHVDFAVLCEETAMREKLEELIQGHLNKSRDLIHDARLPSRKLYIYAQRDVNDRKNPNGWSFAIAHVSNLPNQILAARLMKCTQAECGDVRALAFSLLKEEGLLKHMNVVHIDAASEATLAELVASIFSAFAQKAKG